MSFCSNCGKETIPGDLYCEGCGTRYDQFENQSHDLSPGTATGNRTERNTGKKRGSPFRRIFMFLLLCALATGAYYIKTNWPSGSSGNSGGKVNQPVEQPIAEENIQPQPVTKPAETVDPPQKPSATPAEEKKENPSPPANTSKPGVTTKKTVTAKSTDKKKTVVLFSTWNNNGLLLNNPVVERIKWNIQGKVMITRVTTYHWNGGKGDSGGGTLNFKGAKDYGPFRVVRMEAGDDGTPNAKWIFEPGIILEPGKYKIEQTGKRTLSHNVASAGQGFIKVEGYYIGK